MTEYIEVVLGLGSNLGDRLNFLKLAVEKLAQKEILKDIIKSSIYETKAILKENSPKEWDLNYLNMAVKGKTSLAPIELLFSLKNLESELGRKKSQTWSPREIDIDILVYASQVIKEDNLTIPHAELLNRSFCLEALAEIYPNWKYPVSGPFHQLTILEIIKLVS